MSEPSKELLQATKQWAQHVLMELNKWGEVGIDENGKIIPVWVQAENEILRGEIKNANK